jgi:hypothetical protein
VRHALALIVLAAIPACPVAALGQVQSDGQRASPAGAYHGMFICEQQPGSQDILHVPMDLAVRGNEVQFARPLFNLRGTRVMGSELGVGSLDAAGNVHVTSTWDIRGITVHGDYTGTLTLKGGTMTGTQSWRGPGGEARSRTCQVALVGAGAQDSSDQSQTPR